MVTVMFADVRGYTAMVGSRPPAEMVDLVSTYQRWAAQEVGRHFGVVDKFAGDAVMATFNVSGDQVDHAAHALQAALALRDKAALLGVPVGVGIATGPAVVGTLKTGANLAAFQPLRKRSEEAFKRGDIPGILEILGEGTALLRKRA